MKAQLCLSILLNVVIHQVFTVPVCLPGEAFLLPHPTDCSKFLTSIGGVIFEQQCPHETYWNDAKKVCDFPANVDCATTPSSAPITDRCPEEFDPDHEVFLPHSDCSKFYVCTQQGAIERSCPAGLHWNQKSKVCDWPQIAECTGGTDSPTTIDEVTLTTTVTSTSPSTAEVSTTSSVPIGKCPEVYDPANEVFLPHVDCTKYYLCTWNGRPVEQSCPAGLHWNVNSNQCDWPQVAGCIAGTSISPTESTSKALKPNPSPIGQCPEVYDPSHEVFLPHDDCSKFYVCTQLGAIEQSCPAGLHWNVNSKVCDWPQIAGCIPEPETPTSPEPHSSTEASTTSSVPIGKCPQVYDPTDEVFLPHVDCTKYYLCTWNGRPVEQSCPAGLQWNANANQCDWPALAGCREIAL